LATKEEALIWQAARETWKVVSVGGFGDRMERTDLMINGSM
jgi:hypothetical protein